MPNILPPPLRSTDPQDIEREATFTRYYEAGINHGFDAPQTEQEILLAAILYALIDLRLAGPTSK